MEVLFVILIAFVALSVAFATVRVGLRVAWVLLRCLARVSLAPVKVLGWLAGFAATLVGVGLRVAWRLLRRLARVSGAPVNVLGWLAGFAGGRRITLEQIDRMSGLEFERLVRSLLADRGFHARLTKASGDLGVDIVAQKWRQRYAVQVKRASAKLTARPVQEAVAGMASYGCNRAMVVTNSLFTKGAQKLADANHCELVDRDSLADWLRRTRMWVRKGRRSVSPR